MSEHAASHEPAQHTTTIEIPGNGQVNAGFEDTEGTQAPNGYSGVGHPPANGMPVAAVNGPPMMHGTQTPPPPRETAHMNGETPHMNGEPKTNGVEVKTPGTEETKELTEAVNLELVNMQPYSNSIPIKKESTELDIGDPYDEYFVPVNQHKKYMRGEKLYVTQDKRRSLGGSKKKCCWSILTLVVLGAIVAILLGVILTSQDNNNIEESRNFNGRSSSIGGSLFPTQKTTTNQPPRTTTELVDTFVERVLQGELTIANLEFTPGLANKSSSEFKSLATSVEEELKNALFDHQTLHYGASEITVKVLEFRPGSIVVTYRVGWRFKEGIQNPPDPIDKDGLKAKLLEYLRSKDGYLYNYKLPLHSLKVERVTDQCKIDNGGCSQNCMFDETSLEFACTCNDMYILADDGRTCVKQDTSSLSPDLSSDRDFENNRPNLWNEGDSSAEEPAPEPSPASEEPAPEPALASEEPSPEPSPASEEPAPEPTPASDKPAPEPTPVSEEPAPEPAPASEEPALASEEPAPEPAPASEEPSPEPAPASEEPAPEPAPVSEDTAPEPAPVSEEPVSELSSASEEPTPEPSPDSGEHAVVTASTSEGPAPEPSSETLLIEPSPVSEEHAPVTVSTSNDHAPIVSTSEEPTPEPPPVSETHIPVTLSTSEQPSPEPSSVSEEHPLLVPVSTSEEYASEPSSVSEERPLLVPVSTSEESVSEPSSVSEEHAPVAVSTSEEPSPSTASDEQPVPEPSPASHEPTSLSEGPLIGPSSDFAPSMSISETTPTSEESSSGQLPASEQAPKSEELHEHSFEKIVEQPTLENHSSDDVHLNESESSSSPLSETQPPMNLTVPPDNVSTSLHMSNTNAEMSSTESSSSETTFMVSPDSSSSSDFTENSRDPKDMSAEALFSDNSTSHFEKYINPPSQEVAETTADSSSSTESYITKNMEESNDEKNIKEQPSKTTVNEGMFHSTEINHLLIDHGGLFPTTTKSMEPEQVTMLPEQVSMLPEQVTMLPEQVSMLPEQVTMLPEQVTMLTMEHESPSESSSSRYIDDNMSSLSNSNYTEHEINNTSPNVLDENSSYNNTSANVDSDNSSFTTTMKTTNMNMTTEDSSETMQLNSTYYFLPTPRTYEHVENSSEKTDGLVETITEQTATILPPEQEFKTTLLPHMSSSIPQESMPSARTEKSNFSIWEKLETDAPAGITERVDAPAFSVEPKEDIPMMTTSSIDSKSSAIPTNGQFSRLGENGYLPEYTTEIYEPSMDTTISDTSKEIINPTVLPTHGESPVHKLNISEQFTEQSKLQVDQSSEMTSRQTGNLSDNVSIESSTIAQIINGSIEHLNQNNTTDAMPTDMLKSSSEAPKPQVLLHGDDMPMIALTHIPDLSGPYSVDSTIRPAIDVDDTEPFKATETGEPSIEDSINDEGNSKNWYDSKNSLEDDYNDENNNKKYYKTAKGKHFKSYKTEETNVPHDSDAVEQNFSQITERAPEVTASPSPLEKITSTWDSSANPTRPVELGETTIMKIIEEERKLAEEDAFVTTPMPIENETPIMQKVAENTEHRTSSDSTKDAPAPIAMVLDTTELPQILITTLEPQEYVPKADNVENNSSTTRTVNLDTKPTTSSQTTVGVDLEVTTIINSANNETSPEEMSNKTCATGEFMCADGKMCVAESQRCDGHIDCTDQSDESECPVAAKGCGTDDFQCKNGDCVSKEFVCDSIKQCSDGSDEDDCSNPTNSTVVPVENEDTTNATLTTLNSE